MCESRCERERACVGLIAAHLGALAPSFLPSTEPAIPMLFGTSYFKPNGGCRVRRFGALVGDRLDGRRVGEDAGALDPRGATQR